jgi:hypothetical protein
MVAEARHSLRRERWFEAMIVLNRRQGVHLAGSSGHDAGLLRWNTPEPQRTFGPTTYSAGSKGQAACIANLVGPDALDGGNSQSKPAFVSDAHIASRKPLAQTPIVSLVKPERQRHFDALTSAKRPTPNLDVAP